MALCSWCNKYMPDERLELYPTCKDCTNEKPYFAAQVFEHKTAGYAVLIKGKNTEGIRQAQNANKRKR